ncbi:uncharacterized protein LOC128231403 isoform X1 [Mya arenaria]|uniref:uncharacterized protein LOC128231403 isoform X1 n=1 Tax=Mya arenaria TaxID=6604 RepID=UPI0022E55819|nr:uncharacterized protein LOC128231403 isoform X1 [Mya arenaria]
MMALSVIRVKSVEEQEMSRPGQGRGNSLKQPKEEVNVKYMHRPPRIPPNYGSQRRSLLPKSKVSRVLLYDNATQEHMLDIKLANIKIEKERISRIINLHKKSFSSRMMKKQLHMQSLLNSSTGNKHNSDPCHPASTNDRQDEPSHRVIVKLTDRPLSFQASSNVNIVDAETRDALKERSLTVSDIKFPAVDDDKRHVIFKVKDRHGKTEVYHTVDERGVLSDIIPNSYRKLTDDPRFKSLQNALVPPEETV